MRLKPPPGKKRVADWTGMAVRTRRAMRNGLVEIPAGTLATVEHAGRTGIHLTSAPCKCCGVRIRMTRVSHEDVEAVLCAHDVAAASATPTHPTTVEEGDRWEDEYGSARVLAVRKNWAMLKRRRANPFIASVDQMLRGDYGWRLVERGTTIAPPSEGNQ